MDINELRQLAGLPVAEGEGEVEKVAVGHVDNERDMIMKDLYLIGHYAVELHKMLRDLPDSDFPHWWQSKITKSLEYIDNAKHYLEAELESPEVDVPAVDPEVVDDQDPSGVSQ